MAASILGTLGVNVIARTDGLDKGLWKGGKRLKWYERQALSTTKSVQKAFRGIGTGIVAALGAGAVVSSFKKTADQLDNLAKTSDKLGVLPRQLAGLRHAGEQTGVGISTMDMAMQRFTRRVAEAAKGSGEAKAAIKELGIDAKSLQQLPLPQQMGIIADRMKLVTSQSDRVRLAMKLFDSEGVALVNTLRLGSEGLSRMEAEAASLGMAMSRADLAKVEAMNDELDRLSKFFTSQMASIVIDIAPAALEGIKLLGRTLRAAIGTKGGEHTADSDKLSHKVGRGIGNALYGDNMFSRFMGGNRRRQGAITAQERAAFTSFYDPALNARYDAPEQFAADAKKHSFNMASSRASQFGLMMGLTGGGTRNGQRTESSLATEVAMATAMSGFFNGTQGVASSFAESNFRNREEGRQRANRPSVQRSDNRILERGSAEAFKALRANLKKQSKDESLKVSKDQLEVMEEQRDTLNTIAETFDFEVVS